jgi:hypothetical protein
MRSSFGRLAPGCAQRLRHVRGIPEQFRNRASCPILRLKAKVSNTAMAMTSRACAAACSESPPPRGGAASLRAGRTSTGRAAGAPTTGIVGAATATAREDTTLDAWRLGPFVLSRAAPRNLSDVLGDWVVHLTTRGLRLLRGGASVTVPAGVPVVVPLGDPFEGEQGDAEGFACLFRATPSRSSAPPSTVAATCR